MAWGGIGTRVTHPFVVPIFDGWREPGGACVVSAYLEGGNLDDRPRAEPVSDDDVEHLWSALATAHRLGVTHGAIHGRNVLFDGVQKVQAARVTWNHQATGQPERFLLTYKDNLPEGD